MQLLVRDIFGTSGTIAGGSLSWTPWRKDVRNRMVKTSSGREHSDSDVMSRYTVGGPRSEVLKRGMTYFDLILSM